MVCSTGKKRTKKEKAWQLPPHCRHVYLRCFLAAPNMHFITPSTRACASYATHVGCCSLEALMIHTICPSQVRCVLCVWHPEQHRLLVLITPLHTNYETYQVECRFLRPSPLIFHEFRMIFIQQDTCGQVVLLAFLSKPAVSRPVGSPALFRLV